MMTEAAKKDLALEFMPEVEEIVRELGADGISEEDLLQEGYLGLLAGLDAAEAAGEDEFGDRRGLSFGETVRGAIREAVNDAIKRQTAASRTDDRLVAQVELLNRSIDHLTEELGTKPTIDEIANDMRITQDMVLAILKLTGESVDDEKLTGKSADD